MTKTITMTSKGQITLPADIRRAMALKKPGDKLVLNFKPESQEIVLSRPVSLEDIRAKAKTFIKSGTLPLTDVDALYNARKSAL